MSSYVTRKTPGDTSWFTHDRFGMFIHFGLYSAAARHEWMKSHEFMTNEAYDRYFDHFNPDMLDIREWARQAKRAGMKYVVMTTKHHDGFCLFDSKYTDYKVTNTPYGKDIIKEYVEAFRAEGLHVGFYYSLLDWHHPEFTIDRCHPMKNRPDYMEINKGRDMKKYAEYMRNQVRELLTNYGKIEILWFDYSYDGLPQWPIGKHKEDWESEELIALARSLQPDVMINNRCDVEGDLWTPEQYQPREWLTHPETGELVVWEACQTFSGSWGYYRDEMTWKSPEMLIQMLVNTVSRGGNLLMNIGPTGRGYIDYRAENSLNVFADWMKYNSRSIYGCTMAEPEFTEPHGCRLTQSEDGKRLYLHVVEYPSGSPNALIQMYGMAGKVKYAQFLHDASEVRYRENGWQAVGGIEKVDGLLSLELPPVKPNVVVPVIELFLK